MAGVRENGYFYTDVVASEEEERLMLDSRNTPLIVVGGHVPPSFAETMHDCALKNGLPEIAGHYGYDFGERLFIRQPDADQRPPDAWPSRRLSDIVQGDR